MGQPVIHFEIIGGDGTRLRQYYGELFGWEADADNPMNYGVVPRYQGQDGAGIGGGIAPAMEGIAPHVTIYIAVPDVEAALAKAEQLGGKRLFGPDTPMPGITLGQFQDPEGNTIGVLQG
jgi:uncharacterized protein